jgi:arylmalonate decarboxylase
MPVPPEAFALYPAGIRFVTATIDPGLTLPEDFDQLTSHIVPAAAKLRDSGAKAIMMMAPSLSSYRGADFNEKVSTAVVSATGLPSITASTAIIRGLKTVSARRIAVATAYTDEINLRLQGFLNEKGFEILVLEGSGTDRFEKSAPVAEALTPAEAMQFAVKVREDRPGADTLLLGFGPLATHDLIVPLEKPCRIPVVSASLHALSFGIRLLGIDAKIHGLGTLLEKI